MASKTMNPAAGGRRGSDRKGGISRGKVTILIIFLIPAGLLFLPTTVVLLVGLVPSLVALIIDRDPEKYAAITVAPINFCGVLPLIFTLWQQGHEFRHAIGLLSDPVNWLIMFGAAAVGWVIFFCVPPAVAALLTHMNEAEIKRLTAHQEKLVEEWGPEVAQRSLLAEAVKRPEPANNQAVS